MTWEVYGRPYSTAEATGKTVIQQIKPTDDIVLKAIRTWIILLGDPTFTSVSMDIYSNNSADDTAGSLLHSSSNSVAKATLLTTDNHGLKETYFEFIANGDGVSLRNNVKYNCALKFTGASSWSNTSHCAWRIAYPDPVYSRASVNYNNLLTAPYMITTVIGSDDF